MLLKATKKDIEQQMDFAYSLAMDQTKSGYPLWSDGISTKQEFIDSVWKSYESKNRDILLFVADGAVCGWIQYFYIDEDRYLQTNGFLIDRNTDRALGEFLEYTRAHFAGYALYFGFPKRNTDAIAALQKRNFRLIQECYHDIYIFDGSDIQAEAEGIVKVAESNFSEFSKIHQTDPETYWNSERIFQTLNEWSIYLLYRDDAVAGYICARNGDVVGLGYRNDIFDKSVYKALVPVVLRDAQAAGYKHLIFFNDEETQPAALELGFHCVGEYVLYLGR